MRNRVHASRTRAVAALAACLLAAGGGRTVSAQAPAGGGGSSAAVSGELRRWHPVTLTFDGPRVDESDTPNPFRDYRLSVAFRHGATGRTYVVPGYFAADGAAAESGATSGGKWRVHFTPELVGEWSYTASFRTGPDVAVSLDPLAGRPAAFDGAAGRFSVAETEASGRDFRGRGMLRYVGARYLRLDDGEWFLKAGADSPETLLAYEDFDGTRALVPPGVRRAGEAATSPLHRYAPHVRDWRPGDPTWRGGKGKGLIGALNYLADEGINSISFLTMNVEGDGRNVWPWTAPDVRDRFDVSKLAQWEEVFSHADRLGLHLHFKLQETENDLLLDGGELGPARKLYYRELIARFGHHPALNWNLGEENDVWQELDDPSEMRVRLYAQYIRSLDPYGHNVVIHTYPDQQVEVYVPLLGDRSELTGASIQTAYDRVHQDTRLWVRASRAAGRPWVVANDEQGPSDVGVMPDGDGDNHAAIRYRTLWGNLMAGGAGVEYYFGYRFPDNDLNAEDFRSRDGAWDDARHALEFFRDHLPYWEMESADELLEGEGYVFARPGQVYAVYLPAPREARLDLGRGGGAFTVLWYDPRAGGALQPGSVREVRSGSGRVSIGAPPRDDGGDWVALVRARR